MSFPPNEIQDYWRDFLAMGVRIGKERFKVPCSEMTITAAAELATRLDLSVSVKRDEYIFVIKTPSL